MVEKVEAMYPFPVLIVTAIGVLLTGCAASNRLVLDPVGPPPSQPAAVGLNLGKLVVYSAYEVNADFNARDPYRPEYSDYKIFYPEGELLQKVHNNSGTILQEPATMELPAESYQVMARANGYGIVTVPVLIEARKITVLHLEGGFWSNASGFNQTNAVRLPDGQVVGWKARSGF